MTTTQYFKTPDNSIMQIPFMEIKVRIVNQFGNQRIFPACEKAELFCTLAGTTTLTDAAIKAIKALGYAVLVAQDIKSL